MRAMKFHKAINDEVMDLLKDIAITKGLDDIDYNKKHSLYKVGSKAKDGAIEMQERKFVARGSVELLGNEKFVCIYVSNITDWFRTSPIVSCKKNNNGIILETMNSFYELKENT